MTSWKAVPPCLIKMSYYQWTGIFPHPVKEQKGAEQFRSLVLRCHTCVRLSYCMLSINDNVWWNVLFVQGDEGPLGPRGNAGPAVGTSGFTYSVHTNKSSVAVGVKLLRGSDQKKKTLWALYLFVCDTSTCFFAGEAWKERLHRRTGSWRFGSESYFILDAYDCSGRVHKSMQERLLLSLIVAVANDFS